MKPICDDVRQEIQEADDICMLCTRKCVSTKIKIKCSDFNCCHADECSIEDCVANKTNESGDI
jgi:hypothetical protein